MVSVVGVLGGVRSTNWMWPCERPGKARRERVGEGLNAQRPVVGNVKGWVVPRSLSVVSKVWSL